MDDLERIEQLIAEREVPDALMLRRVLRLRAILEEVDNELQQMERYFTGMPVAPLEPNG